MIDHVVHACRGVPLLIIQTRARREVALGAGVLWSTGPAGGVAVDGVQIDLQISDRRGGITVEAIVECKHGRVTSKERDQLFFVDFEAGVRRIIFSPLSIVQTFE